MVVQKLNNNKIELTDDGSLVVQRDVTASTNSLKLDNCTTISTNSDNLELESNVGCNQHEIISSVYDDDGSSVPYYSKKDSLRTLDAQLLDDAQITSGNITIPVVDNVHWKELILKPRAAGSATFSVKDTDADGCVLNTITEYEFQPGEVDTEVSIPLGNRIKLVAGRQIYVTYDGPAIAGHNFTADPIWGTQFVPFVRTKSQPYVNYDIVTTDRDRVSVYKSSAQTITKETWTDLTFDNERFDVGDMHDNVTNNERITIGRTGLYEVKYLINIQSKKDTDYQGRVYLNGSAMLSDSQLCFFSPKDDTDMCIQNSFYSELTADDYITLQAYQGSAGDRDVHAAKTFFQVRKI